MKKSEKIYYKITRFAKSAGLKTIYTVLLLYYAYRRSETPTWAKNIIMGSIAYFLAPIDGIPDLTPFLGFTDDLGILSFGLVTISAYVNDEVKGKAKAKLSNWFNHFDETELNSIDQKL